MKYSIIINPISKNSTALKQAINFIDAALQQKHEVINVFLYGYAVETAFINELWGEKTSSVKVIACSTIAEEYLEKGLKPIENISITGLGQYMDAVIDADKRIEFV